MLVGEWVLARSRMAEVLIRSDTKVTHLSPCPLHQARGSTRPDQLHSPQYGGLLVGREHPLAIGGRAEDERGEVQHGHAAAQLARQRDDEHDAERPERAAV